MMQLSNPKRINSSEQQYYQTCSNFLYRFTITPQPYQFKASQFRINKNKEKCINAVSNLNNRSIEYLNDAKGIKSKLEKLFDKDSKKSLKKWILNNHGKGNKKVKPLFFKGNYKLNKSKK
jgi:hypothetical protein